MGWLLWTVLVGAQRVDVRLAGCRASPSLFSCFARDKKRQAEAHGLPETLAQNPPTQ